MSDRNPKTPSTVYTAPRLELLAVEGGADVTVFLRGELELASAYTLQEAVGSSARGSNALILDLSGLSFIDGSGVRAILDARDACTQRKIPLWLAPGPRAVQRVFELTGVTTRLSWATSEDRELLGPAARAIAAL